MVDEVRLEPVPLAGREQRALIALVDRLPPPRRLRLLAAPPGRRGALLEGDRRPPVMVDGRITLAELTAAAAACDAIAGAEPHLTARELVAWIRHYVRPRGSKRRGRPRLLGS